jgi:type VI secretion system VasD/TssJ family lipoprotein
MAVLISFLMILSCASAPIPPPEWRYEKEAIKLTLQADPQLNLYKNMAHTLQLCVYQLKDPNGFNQLTETEEGLYKLLEGSMFDASVANFKRLNMSPGQSMPFTMDRAEGAKYIGIAAGYATIQKDRITRLISIPVIIVEEGSGFKKQTVSRPEIINLKLRLGPHQIEAGKGE